MNYQILYKEAFPLVEIKLQKGEMIKAESGAMVSMSSTIDVEGRVEGGFMKGLGRMFAGEKFFFQTLIASRGAGEVLLAPSALGGVVDIELDGSYGLCVQKDGFLAATQNIEVSTQMQNLTKGLFSGEGFFIVRISGRGTVFVNSLGAIHAINIPDQEEVIIDNSHLVAWPEYMQYSIEKASKGWISSFTSGEGLVCRFRGPGTVLIQSRNPSGFGSWVRQFIPSSK
ncbi:TIGR00266 family protein [Crassaminicella thermophila]|uniref:TIGR00266 family protein n=1 Tax=Crassaminicella thermophila TaxID=2599308 RepID=A0A5C0SDK2_CRATE|nr:TIGR00266 family protein [Crassaminicella thermophila]QEK11009.1 TIGR00266 family protein [Crassaminicella thermophila]